jgi:hypothetical protein
MAPGAESTQTVEDVTTATPDATMQPQSPPVARAAVARVTGLSREVLNLLPRPDVPPPDKDVLPADVGPSILVSYVRARVPPDGGWTGELADSGQHCITG